MRRFAALLLALPLAGLIAATPAPAATADVESLAGPWKLVLMPSGEVDFAIFDLKAADGKLTAEVTNASQMYLGAVKTAEGTIAGDRLNLTFANTGPPVTFKGTLDKSGKLARGAVNFRGSTYPGKIERTADKEISAAMKTPAAIQQLAQVRTLPNDQKAAKLIELIDTNVGHPSNGTLYAQLVGVAEAAGMKTEEVGKLVARWIDEAKIYGDEWAASTEATALKSLQGKKAFAGLATEMALAADKALPADASTERKANVAGMLAASARLAGNDAVANEAEGRAKAYDAQLDTEYHQNVPPFKPEKVAARSADKGNRVVVMEIFTGAECPPCVAADVAFDALLATYQPTEFIGLQHHLHIPGPDPLTNDDTVTRQGYYGSEIRGTPTVFFNGKVLPGGGGGMAGSEAKYQEYRKAVDPDLEKKKQADIALTATRHGDEIKITAKATLEGSAQTAKPMLRLVLVEDSVRYPGGNKLRFHENVVRAFPGGVAGKPIDKSEGIVEATVNLADLRKQQDAYLAKYPTTPRGRAFPNPIPPMELRELAVVALVQDDADHAIWHAVQVPVKSETP
jgi:hypothetical protein